MKKRKVLLLGFGSIGKRHAELLSKNTLVDSVSLVSKSATDDRVIAKNIDELSNAELNVFDVFFICSETISHEHQLKYVDTNVNGKLIVVEKPLFAHPNNFNPRNKTVVSYNLRFSPVIQFLKEKILGQKVLSCIIEAGQYLPTWRPGTDIKDSYSTDIKLGGGVLRDLSHELDYMYMLFGEYSILSAISTSESHLNINADDITSILATSKACTHLFICVDYLAFSPKRSIKIQTDENTIYADLIANTVDVCSLNTTKRETFKVDRNTTYSEMHNDIFLNEGNKLTSFEDALYTVNQIEHITQNYWEKDKNG